jgi:transcriptional regulator with XRE-family HTH domain
MEKTLYSKGFDLLVQRLREARLAAGVTQVELASRLKTTQVFISKCEQGGRRLDALELRRWCQALGLSFNEFIKKLDAELSKRGL